MAIISMLTLALRPSPILLATESSQALIEDATAVIRAMQNEKDTEIMRELLRGAEGVAIFSSVVKAGLVFGGRYGQGIVLKRDRNKDIWYGPHFVTLSGVFWGLQIGVQKTALVMVIMNERGMKGFTGDKVTLGGDIAIAAGPVGRQTGVGTDGGFKAEIYSYSKSKGLFAGVSLEGSIISSDNEVNEEFWGSRVPVENILSRKSGDRGVESLVKTIAGFQSREAQKKDGSI